ncbi:glycerol kinase GlpK [Amedibacillus dolichus]|uniref:Glycerol kinase n=1 Tax=Amedibacillus dolichus TaxID=31971 RepID=A0ABT7UDM8_9FIRM|nr:glycerol kinase GlpK [Amedibacillus dolichus]MDM8157704.1 glycerol kinase GlpK [Amedibacillus dolichus]
MKRYILAIDQGTTSSRAILFDEMSNILAVAQKEVDTYYPHPGWVEQNANDIWASVVGVMNEVVARSGIRSEQIAAIGITNQRETSVIWEKESGQPIGFAIVWQSRQSDSYCQRLKEEGREAWIREKTGLQLDPYFSASKIRFLLDRHGLQERAERGELCFGTIDSWLVWKMSNGKKHITDVSNASRTMLMNLEMLDYDEELLALWNIPRCLLPKIVDTSGMLAVCETVFASAIPITAVVGDQQAALFGQTCFDGGDVKNTYGTGCFLLMNTKDRIIRSKHGLVTCVGWRIQGVCDYVLEGSVFVAGAAVQWLRDGLHLITTSAESEERARLVESSDGVIVVPAFTGLGAPYWKPQVKGAMFGLTRGTRQEHIIRATLESLAYQSCDVITAMEEDAGMKIHHLQVDGGASRNSFLMQFQSDLLNATVIRSTISETTALGAAYLAGLAIGYWKDQAAIKEQFQIARRYVPTIDPQTRERLLKGWKKAVQAAIAFA